MEFSPYFLHFSFKLVGERLYENLRTFFFQRSFEKFLLQEVLCVRNRDEG